MLVKHACILGIVSFISFLRHQGGAPAILPHLYFVLVAHDDQCFVLKETESYGFSGFEANSGLELFLLECLLDVNHSHFGSFLVEGKEPSVSK